MKKIIVLLISILTILAIVLAISLFITPVDKKTPEVLVQEENILENSSWIRLTSEDFNGYLNGTYTETIKTIINSLENAVPVILHISTNRFNNSEFVIASSFNSSNQVYIYYYNSSLDEYNKVTSSLESLLEDATDVLIYNELEGQI